MLRDVAPAEPKSRNFAVLENITRKSLSDLLLLKWSASHESKGTYCTGEKREEISRQRRASMEWLQCESENK
jgi:hypothetical protein